MVDSQYLDNNTARQGGHEDRKNFREPVTRDGDSSIAHHENAKFAPKRFEMILLR